MRAICHSFLILKTNSQRKPNNLKILIIVPSRSYNGQPGYIDFPDEMLFLAAVLESRGHKIKFNDSNVETLTIDSVKQFQPSLVVLYVSTGPEIADALSKSRDYKTLGAKVAWCGCHPTALPEQTLSIDCVDYIGIGGAEETLAELVSHLEAGESALGSISGLGYKDDSGNIRLNRAKTSLRNADVLPDPAWHLVDFKRYPDTNLNTSRGERYASTFFPDTGNCNTVIGGELSPMRIVALMKRIRREFGVRRVYFSGCSLAADSDRFKGFCRAAINSKLKTAWTLPVATNLDEETVWLMKKARCVSVLLDVGSGRRRLRQFLEKGDLGEVEKTFWMLVKHKIIPTVFVNYGYPLETEADFKETLEVLKRLDQPPTLFLKYVPYPGMRLFDYAISQGLITKPQHVEDWAEFVQTCLSRNLSAVSQEQFNQALADFRQTYASRRIRFMARHNPGYFFSIIWKPREFFKRIGDLFRYYAGSVRQKKNSS